MDAARILQSLQFVVVEIAATERDVGRHGFGRVGLLLHEHEFGPFGMCAPQRQDVLGSLERAAAGEVEKPLPVSGYGGVVTIR